VDSGAKLLITFSVLAIALVAWTQMEEETHPIPTEEKLFFEGTIGGKHFMSMSINRTGKAITGNAINTQKALRSLKGSIRDGGVFTMHEYDGDRMTGTFDGKILDNGNLRGIWSFPPGEKWFPFYLQKRPKAIASFKVSDPELTGQPTRVN
jgi:hypothetical protein